MALAIDTRVDTPSLPTSPSLILALNTSSQAQPEEASASATSKGKMFSKGVQTISPVLPIPGEIQLIAIIAAMMVAIQAMEISINKLMATATKCESAMMTDAAKANVASEKENIDLAIQQEEKEKEEESRNSIMKILSYIGAAITSAVSFGTMTAIAAMLVVAVTVLDTLGYLSQGVDSLLSKCGVNPDSAGGKWLSFVVKAVITLVITMGTGAVAAAETEAKTVEQDASVDGMESANSAANQAANAGKFARNMQLAGTLGGLDPIGELIVAIKRSAVGGHDDDTENWIKMASGILNALVGMAAMFSAAKSTMSAGSALSRLGMNMETMAKINLALTSLAVALNVTSACIQIDTAKIKLDKSKIEDQIGQSMKVTEELKSLVEMLQQIGQSQQSWVKQNVDIDKQLSDSFQYDEFASFASVNLQG